MLCGALLVLWNHFSIKSLCKIKDLYIIKLYTVGFYKQTLFSYKTTSTHTFLEGAHVMPANQITVLVKVRPIRAQRDNPRGPGRIWMADF